MENVQYLILGSTVILLLLGYVIYRLFSGTMSCFWGHDWERTGGHSTGASWSESSKCAKCEATKYESGNMFD